jgi:hypothetical protein
LDSLNVAIGIPIRILRMYSTGPKQTYPLLWTGNLVTILFTDELR